MANKNEKSLTVDDRLSEAFSNLFVNINNLQMTCFTTKALFEVGNIHFKETLEKKVKELLAKPDWQNSTVAKTMQDNQPLMPMAMQAVAKRTLRISGRVIDSAALVFAHTILDGTLSDCCAISFEAEPSDWFQFVKNRKIAIGDALKSSAGDLCRREAQLFIEQLKRESMIKRLNLLNSVCIPKLKDAPAATSLIKQEQLENFDQLRHRIVHEQQFADKLTDVEEQLFFASIVGLCVLLLVGKAYGLKAGGLLDKDTEKETLLKKLYSGAFTDFPELDEQLKPLTDLTNSLASVLNKMKPTPGPNRMAT